MNTTSEAFAEQKFLTDVLRRFKARRWLIIGITMSMFLLIAMGIEMLPKAYSGVAAVVIEGQTPSVSSSQGGDGVLRDMAFDDQTIGTEVEILQSRELLTDAINRSGLLSKPEFNPNIRPAGMMGQVIENLRVSLAVWFPNLMTDVPVAPSEKAMGDTLDVLKKHVKLMPVPHSRVIQIAVSANNNQLAAQIANTIADLYIANHMAYKANASREAHQFLDDKIGELRRDADLKAQALERYRIDNGLTTAMTSTLVQEQVSGLSNQLQAATARLADLQAQANTARRVDPQQLSTVLNSPTIAKYREQEAAFAAQRAQLAATYGPNHPMLGRIDAQLASVRGQIAAEVKRAASNLGNDVASAQSNVDDLTKRLTLLRGQASKMDEARAHMQSLEADSSAANAVRDQYLNKLRSIDASMAYAATDVRIISHAAPPIHAAFPNQLVLLPAGFILSLLTGCAVAYWTSKATGLTGTTDIEAFFGGIEPLGMIPIRTPQTVDHFDTAVEQLLSRIWYLESQPRTILITSSLPEEGKTTTARALADAAMRRNIDVFLVDADMWSARRIKPYTSATTMGLGEVLRGEVHLDDAVTRRQTGSVPMLTAGAARGNPTRLMALPAKSRQRGERPLSVLESTLGSLADRHELVIVDAPPALVGGCEMLMEAVDTAVFLAKWDSTPADTIAFAIKRLGVSKIAGMVLTMVDPHRIARFGQADAVPYSSKLYKYYSKQKR